MMGCFKPQFLSWIVLSAICVSCQELTSTLREGNHACSGEEVVFTCSVRDSPSILAWRSTEYIGQDNLLQFTTANMLGASDRSIINRNVVATLTNNTDINGVRVLESKLYIVADQASTVMCTVTNVGTWSTEFSISAVPGVPQRISAQEISQPTDNICILLVTWDPPANSSGSDIDRYIVYIPSRNISRDIFSSTLSTFPVPNCDDDIRILVAAVNRFGCEGMNSSEVQPSLLNIPTAPAENAMTTEASSASTSSQLGVGAVLGITLGAMILILCLLVIICICCLKRYANKNAIEELHDLIEKLYVSLKFNSPVGIQNAVELLSRKLKKSSGDDVKEAILNLLKEMDVNEYGNKLKALANLKKIVPDLSTIDEELQKMYEKLKEFLENEKPEEALDYLKKKVKNATRDGIKGLLQKFCDEISKQLDESDPKKCLIKLYKSLKSQSAAERGSAVGLLRTGLKKLPADNIKEAVKSSLDALKWKEHDDVQGALDKVMEIILGIPDIDDVLKVDYIHSKIKKLKDNAISPEEDELENVLDDLMEKVEIANPDDIKKILLKLCDMKLKVPKLSPEQEEVVGKFEIPLQSLREIEELLTAEFVKGLKREEDDVKVKMLNTCVHSMPDGTEEGEFLVINLGGRNLRVLHIKINNGKRVEVLDFKRFSIDKTQEDLFEFIAQSVAEFIKERKITKKLPVGFPFSFPVKQESLISGKLIRLTRGYKATGAEGKDVVQLLKAAFDRRGDVKVDVVALVNNTTATQLAACKEVPDCSIGLILGDGTNACYMESLDAVPKLKGDRGHYYQVIINTEWGAFGDDGKLDKWRTDYDSQLDKESNKPGEQLYEKMISGTYLGEIVRLALKDLIKKGELFEGKSPAKFDTFAVFSTRRLSLVEGGDIGDCKKLFKTCFSIEASDKDCEVIRRVCEAVSTRAARLAAAGVVALVKKIKKIDSGCTVAVDGSLYKRHPKFADRMKDALDELAPRNKIKMKLTEHGSNQGAAYAAAMACRLAAAGECKSPGGPAGSVITEGQQEVTYVNVDVHPLGVNIEMEEKVPRTTV